MNSRLASFPFYPLLFGLYFPIFLYSRNLDRYSIEVAVVPVLLSGAANMGLGFLCVLAFRNIHRAALWFTANLCYFFVYGGIFRTLKPMIPGSHKILLAVGIVLNIVLWWIIWKRPINLVKWSVRINLIGCILFILPFATLVRFYVQEGFGNNSPRHAELPEDLTSGGPVVETRFRPDIYHILMDGYSRADVLKAAYGFDNSGFLRALRERGFQIGQSGNSNYSATDLSLGSSLNMNYLDSLDINLEADSRNWKQLEALRNFPEAVRVLKARGYRWIVVPHGWENTLPDKADAIRTPPAVAGDIYLSEFQNGVLSMTPIPYLLTAFGLNELRRKPQHRNRILYEFDYLMHCAHEPGPKYVFVHILGPHSPIVFGPNGEPKDDIPDLNFLRSANPELFRQAAMGEITYLNKRILEVVNKLIKDTDGNAVILLHSDHGESVLDFSAGPEFLVQRHAVLGAIRLPGGARDSAFYPSMSNVNYFRFIFNHIFGTGYPLLADRTWYSPSKTPFQFREITSVLDSARNAQGAPSKP